MVPGKPCLALMFLGRLDEARAIFLAYRGKTVKLDGDTWERTIHDDFTEMRAATLNHPLMNEIERAFTAR
jgi:hypothetical protein